MNKIVNLGSVKQTCNGCGLAEFCLPSDLNKQQLEQFNRHIQHNHLINKGEFLFEQHQPFKSLFMIRTGFLKSYIATNDGHEQVFHFHMPGELVGLDALGYHLHSCSVVALETTTFCKIPYKTLHDMYGNLVSLSDHFLSLLSYEIAEQHELMLIMNRKSAEARVAFFLLSMSSRFKVRGFSPYQFNLNIPRYDIANYLGLAVETISRIMSHLHKERILEIDRRSFCILDLPGLYRLAEVGENDILSPLIETQTDH